MNARTIKNKDFFVKLRPSQHGGGREWTRAHFIGAIPKPQMPIDALDDLKLAGVAVPIRWGAVTTAHIMHTTAVLTSNRHDNAMARAHSANIIMVMPVHDWARDRLLPKYDG